MKGARLTLERTKIIGGDNAVATNDQAYIVFDNGCEVHGYKQLMAPGSTNNVFAGNERLEQKTDVTGNLLRGIGNFFGLT